LRIEGKVKVIQETENGKKNKIKLMCVRNLMS